MSKRALIFAMAILATCSTVQGGERYYAIIFGSQSQPKQLRYSHTWATFVKVVGEGDDLRNYQVFQHTISWLPASLKVRVWALRPEPGVNLDLYNTLDFVARDGQSVAMWGPFEILGQVYNRSLKVKEILEGGAVDYRAISTARELMVSDCIHAVAAVDPILGRNHYPLIRIGKPASRFVARQLTTRSVFDQYQTDAAWLIPRLGLDRYPIEVISPQEIPKRGCFLCRCPD
ncbi:hypothetical protein [Singulisphaera sp. PoT]|uniref:hypothetical protein n=1 Tax=Singulisphaera sp. PoT TaxID=3411797 RepID=UPI003BF56870